MTTTVFFVRHGVHDRLDHILCGRMDGVALSAEGHLQARRAAARLVREPIRALYVSPLQRAQETAAPIGVALGLAITTTDSLNEIDVGDWTGASFDVIRTHPAWGMWNQARSHHRAPGGETMLEVQARLAGFLVMARADHPNCAIAAVCHSDVIKAALCYAISLSLDHHYRLEISPGSISVLVGGPWGLKVHSMNEVPP